MKKATFVFALLVLTWGCQRVELENLGDKKVDLKVNFVTGPTSSNTPMTKSTSEESSDVVFGSNDFNVISHEKIDLDGFDLKVYASQKNLEDDSEGLIYEKHFEYEDLTFDADFGIGMRWFEIIASNEPDHVPGIYGFQDYPAMPEENILYMHFWGQTEMELKRGENQVIPINAHLDNAGAELVFEPPVAGAYQGPIFYEYQVTYEMLNEEVDKVDKIVVGEVDFPDDDPYITKNDVTVDYEGTESLILEFIDIAFVDDDGSDVDNTFYRWKVSNGSDNEYVLDWDLTNNDEAGKITLGGHKSVYFSTNSKGTMVVGDDTYKVSAEAQSTKSPEFRRVADEKRRYYPKALINGKNKGLRICGIKRSFIVGDQLVDSHDMTYKGKPVCESPLLFEGGVLARVIVENDLHVVIITPVVKWEDWDKEEVIITK